MSASKFTLEYFQTTPAEEMLDDAVTLLRNLSEAVSGCPLDHDCNEPFGDGSTCPFSEAETFVEQHDLFTGR